MRVKSVKAITLETPIPVYDLTMPKYENFVLDAGVVVHNCKRARNKSFQAVYPLKGKPLNVIEASKDKILNNKEVYGLLAAVGVDLGGKTSGEVGYGKIICMADPDVDGKHINCLMMAVMWRFLPHIFKQGKVYVVRAPLYKARHKGQTLFGMTKESIHKKAGTDKVDITYIKGYGELSERDLGVAIDPDQRTLYKVLAPDTKGAKRFTLLLGKSPGYRKKLFGVI